MPPRRWRSAAVRLYQPEECAALPSCAPMPRAVTQSLIKLIGKLSDAGGSAIALTRAAADARIAGCLRKAA